MSVKESKIKHLIREYLLEEGILKKNIPNTEKKLDFGFQFSFPPGPRGHMMVVFKPKNKNLLIISVGTQIAQPHITALNSLKPERKMQYFMELRKLFLLKELFYRIDIQNYRYEISDQIFIEENNLVLKNDLFRSVRTVFNCAAYSNIILGEFCEGKVKPEDFMKSKEFLPGPDFSLYS